MGGLAKGIPKNVLTSWSKTISVLPMIGPEGGWTLMDLVQRIMTKCIDA